MALKLEEKKAIVADLAKVVADASSAVIANYRGLTVAELTELRAKAREEGVYLRVVRNTLARRALQDTNFSCLTDRLTGALCLAFAYEEPGAAARLLRDFAKEHEVLEVKGLALDGQFLEASSLAAVADLPNRDRALAMLLGVMQAPISKLVRTLAEPHAKLTRTMAAVGDKVKAA